MFDCYVGNARSFPLCVIVMFVILALFVFCFIFTLVIRALFGFLGLVSKETVVLRLWKYYKIILFDQLGL